MDVNYALFSGAFFENEYDYPLLVRELTFDPPPPPHPWGISETYISKNLIPSAVQISLSALISRVRLPWRANCRSVPPSF